MQKEGMAFWKHRLSHNNVHVQERLKVHQNTSGTLQFLQDEASSIKPQGGGMDDLFRKMLSFYQQYFCCFYHYYFQICKKRGVRLKKKCIVSAKRKIWQFCCQKGAMVGQSSFEENNLIHPLFFFDRIEVIDTVWFNFNFCLLAT